jgi:hypothetical protein
MMVTCNQNILPVAESAADEVKSESAQSQGTNREEIASESCAAKGEESSMEASTEKTYFGFNYFDEIFTRDRDTMQVTTEELISTPQIALARVDLPIPNLCICILVVGTRGDVQPFIYLGQCLKEHGHRVRIATHIDYRDDVVVKGGLEYYPLAGNPRKLTEFMVKTSGKLVPNFLNQEEVQAAVDNMMMVHEISHSCWPACTQPDPDDPDQRPFTAEAIISNPVTYGHIHVAEALGVPLVSSTRLFSVHSFAGLWKSVDCCTLAEAVLTCS